MLKSIARSHYTSLASSTPCTFYCYHNALEVASFPVNVDDMIDETTSSSFDQIMQNKFLKNTNRFVSSYYMTTYVENYAL